MPRHSKALTRNPQGAGGRFRTGARILAPRRVERSPGATTRRRRLALRMLQYVSEVPHATPPMARESNRQKPFARTALKWLAGGIGVAAATYGAYIGSTWYRYGRVTPASPGEDDRLLDQFMPAYEVVERHHIRISAPAAVAFAFSCEMDLEESLLVRATIRGRELLLGAMPATRSRPQGLLADMQSIGWGILAEVPGREIVVGVSLDPGKRM